MIARRHTKPIIAYYARGYSMRETATKFDLSLERIRQILRRDCPEIIRRPNYGTSMAPKDRLKLEANSR